MTPKSDLSFEFQSISVTLEYLRLHTSLYCMFSPLHTDVHTRTHTHTHTHTHTLLHTHLHPLLLPLLVYLS